jgi:hypothetical protein
MVEPNRIQGLSDDVEIQALLTRYCTAVDSKQYAMLDTVFTPDAFIDYTSAGGITKSRCMFYNPMGLPLPEGQEGLQLVFFGGYYNDKLTRTPEGWRISERIEESTWQYGQLPERLDIPE